MWGPLLILSDAFQTPFFEPLRTFLGSSLVGAVAGLLLAEGWASGLSAFRLGFFSRRNWMALDSRTLGSDVEQMSERRPAWCGDSHGICSDSGWQADLGDTE